VALTTAFTRISEIASPEPDLTPEEMIARAHKMIPILRARQAECEAGGNVPEEIRPICEGQRGR
jgi:3-hydroxy-9,10-secoandrosta-1,3,5(10)-triene-9,17-dione monooxygenase